MHKPKIAFQMKAPCVMVSSTCYDLRQIRADLGDFLSKELGYQALLSEFPSFPVDPDLSTVENCRSRVEQNADVLVLVIGGRYGTIDKRSDKSVTNLEYLTARQVGIPVYAFVDKQMLSILPVWRTNKEGNYSNVVDSTRVFAFVEELRNKDGVWTFPFESAQEIIGTLRVQLAYMFHECMAMRRRFVTRGVPRYLDSLRPKAFRIALERPKGWEYLLFLQAWADEVEKNVGGLREYDSKLAFGSGEQVMRDDAVGWIKMMLSEIIKVVNSAQHIIDVSFLDAVGPVGQPGDPEKIVWCAVSMGKVLESILVWAQRLRGANIDEDFSKAAKLLADTVRPTVENLRKFPSESLARVEKAITGHTGETGNLKLTETLSFALEGMDAFGEALKEAQMKG